MKRVITIVLMCCIMLYYIPNIAYANAPGPEMDGEAQGGNTYILVFAVTCLICMVFTCFVEYLIGKPFGLEYHTKEIILVNIVSQVIMHILELLSMSFAPYAPFAFFAWYVMVVIILEILVCIGEFLFYRFKMRELSWKQCLLYTLCANAGSALGGLLLLQIIL